MSDPKGDCEAILGVIMPFAEEMLRKHREFYPFGGVMSGDGTISQVGGWTGEERPDSTELLAFLEGAIRAMVAQGNTVATALAYDIRTIPPGKQKKQDAVAVALDHRNNYSVVVIFPYSFTLLGRLQIEAPFATQGASKIFAPQ